MAGTVSRWAFIDDISSSIKYTGPWYETTNSPVPGPMYGKSQHGVNGTGSLTYDFSGTNIRAVGTSAATQQGGVVDPSWECTVDGVAIPVVAVSAIPQNQRVLCQTTSPLADTQHTFALTAKSAGTPFWFDSLLLNPSVNPTGAKPDQPDVLYLYDDPSIQYPSGSWQAISDTATGSFGQITQQAGSTMYLGFTGTKVTWYGRMVAGYPSGASQGSYSIDGGSPTTFDIPGNFGSWSTQYQQVFFETQTLTREKHNITVKFLGAAAPLFLEYLTVQNGDLVFTGNDKLPASIGDHDKGGYDGDEHPHSSTGVIVGGVLGGVALIVLIVVIFFLWRKLQQRRRIKGLTSIEEDEPTGTMDQRIVEATPFMSNVHGPSNPGSPAPSLPVSPAPTASTFNTRPLSLATTNNAFGGSQAHSATSYPSAAEEKARLRAQDSSTQLYNNGAGSSAAGGSRRADSYLTSGGTDYASVSGSGSVTSSQNEKAKMQYVEAQRAGGSVVSSNLVHQGSMMAVVNPDAEAEATLVHHQDSGMRMTGDPEEIVPPSRQVIDVPPSYTP